MKGKSHFEWMAEISSSKAMKIIAIVTVLLLFVVYYSHCQTTINFSIGAMVSNTDLGGRSGKGLGYNPIKDFEPSQTHASYSICISRQWDNWEIGLQFATGNISGSDNIKNKGGAEIFRIIRHNTFETSINEFAFTGKKYFGSGIRPFILAGAGCFRFTEKKDGTHYQPVLLYGGGLNYTASDNIQLEVTAIGRNTFTDNLDNGVHDVPYTKGDDSYGTLSIGLVLTGLFRHDVLRCWKNY